MHGTPEQFFGGTKGIIDDFDVWAMAHGPAARADHVCFKCGDAQEFEALRSLFEKSSEFIYQSIISQRRIAVIKFLQPLPTALGDIWFLELSDQKPDGSQHSGFDHIEIYPTAGTVEALAAALEGGGVHFEKVVRPHHTTFDAHLGQAYKIRLESEPLVDKIKRDEMR